MYGLFYSKDVIGDVLMIIIDDVFADNIIKTENVTALYKNNRLIGVNIFNISKIVKIKSNGLILFPPESLIHIINSILKQHNIQELSIQKESGFVVGKVIECNKHPNSDHLHVCKVDVKRSILDIVCGAPNVKKDMKVVVALSGSVMFDGTIIKPSSLRGIKSEGMLCSSRELNIKYAPNIRGLLELGEEYEIGEDFFLKEIQNERN